MIQRRQPAWYFKCFCEHSVNQLKEFWSGRLLCIYDNARRASKDYYLTSLGASEHSWIPWSGIS
jgi:hypothetical protein